MKGWLLVQKKKLRRWQRRYKGFKIFQKMIKILIVLANIGITLWQIYDQYIKERLDKGKTT